MIFNCLTLFPEMFRGFLDSSIAIRAQNAGILEINCIDFRKFTTDRHGRVDDYPFGGDPGMLLCAQPLFDCFKWLAEQNAGRAAVTVYMSPGGAPLRPETAQKLAQRFEVVNVLCGHYEGVDQRVLDTFVDEEISIGDYVLTGGELPAMVLVDCVMRYIPGVLGNDLSAACDSFSSGLLEYPQYTRPRVYEGMSIPDILLSGHHERIANWRRKKALEKTHRVRPDLLEHAELSADDRKYLKELSLMEENKNEQGYQGH